MSLRADVLCRKGCGFYGNPEWQWYCSKCWKQSQLQQSPSKASNQRFLTTSGSPSPSSVEPGSSKPIKLSPKKTSTPKDAGSGSARRQALEKNVKQLFGARMNTKESPEKSPKISASTATKPSSKPQLPKEAQEASKEFANFLNKRLERKSVSDVSKQINDIVEKILKYPLTSSEQIDDLSALVQEFYQLFQRRLETSPFYKSLTDDDKDKILELTEKYITIRCYKTLFCPNVTQDEDKDLELQNRIRSLNWISTEHLNASIDEFSQEVRDLLYQAINDLLEIDGKMTPQDKMACLVKSSKNIFEILKLSSDSPASADDFLPCLIYICLKANPPRIQSNINYITRFCNENKLRMGEGGYFFANLCCAMSFIENLTAESVNMDPNEFESYTTGKSVPLESWRSNLLMCDGLQSMSQNLKLLSDLKLQQEQIIQGAKDLQLAMDKFQLEIQSEVDQVLDKTKYEIRTKEPIDLDADLEQVEDLPTPLLPINTSTVHHPDHAKAGTTEKTLEDYLSMSDNMSLLSLDMTQASSCSELDLESSYRGFSAQSSSIPSISCDTNAAALPSTTIKVALDQGHQGLIRTSTSSEKTEANSSTASSSPIISAPTSPDDQTDVKASDPDTEEEEHKVLSGIFENEMTE